MSTFTPIQSLPLFSELTARDKGLAQALRCRTLLVQQVREHLELIARARGNRCVTMDDAEPFLLSIGKTSGDLGNAAGMVFRHAAWEFTGCTTPSTRKGSHARHVRVWRLR